MVITEIHNTKIAEPVVRLVVEVGFGSRHKALIHHLEPH